jgi:hypothetical protein
MRQAPLVVIPPAVPKGPPDLAKFLAVFNKYRRGLWPGTLPKAKKRYQEDKKQHGWFYLLHLVFSNPFCPV